MSDYDPVTEHMIPRVACKPKRPRFIIDRGSDESFLQKDEAVHAMGMPRLRLPPPKHFVCWSAERGLVAVPCYSAGIGLLHEERVCVCATVAPVCPTSSRVEIVKTLLFELHGVPEFRMPRVTHALAPESTSEVE